MTTRSMYVAAALALIIPAAAMASDVAGVTSFNGGKQVWLKVTSWDTKTAQFQQATIPNTMTDPLSGAGYHFPQPSPGGTQDDWWVEYSIPAAAVPGVDLSGTWYFDTRSTQLWWGDIGVGDAPGFTDSDWLFVKGDDGVGVTWYSDALASRDNGDDRILNDVAPMFPGGYTWNWWGNSAYLGGETPPQQVIPVTKQFNVIDGAVTFRIYEREAAPTNVVIDMIVWSSASDYEPTDEDYLSLSYFPGDADNSGTVDLADLAVLATNWNAEGRWAQGDFNYDGNVDLADLAILATNWNQSAGDVAAAAAALGLPAIPEPATMGLLAIGGLALLRRRR